MPTPPFDSVIQQGKASYPRQTPFARHRSNHPNASCPRPPATYISRERENREIFGRLDGSLDAHLVVKGLALGHWIVSINTRPCPCPTPSDPMCSRAQCWAFFRASLPRAFPAMVPVASRRLDGHGTREWRLCPVPAVANRPPSVCIPSQCGSSAAYAITDTPVQWHQKAE